MTDQATDAPRVISIDPPGARELDDAIAVRRNADGSWRVDVCLPDVPALVQRGDANDHAARERGLTTYSADAIRTSMLPAALVERLSLSPHEPGPVVHVAIDVTPDLQAAIALIRRTHQRTHARLTYAEADRILDDGSHALHPDLASLWDLASRLHEERAASTGAVFDLQAGVATDEEGRTVRLAAGRAHRGNLIVMEMMILANSALAAHAHASGAAVLYRNHRLAGMARGDRAAAAAELALSEGIGRTVAARRLRGMAHMVGQAEIGVHSLGHHGLDQRHYAWFTSPLRRYCDIVNLRAVLEGACGADHEELAARLSDLHRRAKDDSASHHARRAREVMIQLVARRRHDRLREYDVHTLVRALGENTDFDREAAEAHLQMRMEDDTLSGRDIAALVDEATRLLGEPFAGRVAAWATDERRALLLRDHRQGTIGQTRVATSEVNHKGILLERATARRARVQMLPPVRSGPPHAPVFQVTARWERGVDAVEAVGTGRSLKAAEHDAARMLMDKLDVEGDAAPRVGTSGPTETSRAILPAKPGTPPKTALLEIAACTPGADVEFAPARMSGPTHAPSFEVDVTLSVNGRALRETGRGTSRREAERTASEAILSRLARIPRHEEWPAR